MRVALRAAAALLALALLAACGEPPVARERQQVDDLVIFFERPERIPVGQPVDMVVTLVSASDSRTLNGAQVTLDMEMSAMPMGQSRPLADPLGGGRYRARAAFTMAGPWRTTVIVLLNGREYRAAFDQQATE